MSVILRSDRDVHAEISIYGLLRYAELPKTRSVLPRLKALQDRYWRLVGKELAYPEAVWVLDRIINDRDEVPFPRAYARIADHLLRAEYDVDCIHLVIGHLARGGSVESCRDLSPTDRALVLDLLPPRSYRPDPGRYAGPEDCCEP